MNSHGFAFRYVDPQLNDYQRCGICCAGKSLRTPIAEPRTGVDLRN